MRAIAPKADLRPFHSSARSASSCGDADGAHAVLVRDRDDPRHVGLEPVRQPDHLDQQRRRRVDRQPGVDVCLDRDCRHSWSIISTAAGTMPAAMMPLTVAAPSSTVSKSISIVRTAGGFWVSLTQTAVAMPSMPSLPTNAPRRS